MSKLLREKMKNCKHPQNDMWPNGSCPHCGWYMWETYFENQEELDIYNYNKQLLNLDQKELVKRYVDLERKLEEARENIYKYAEIALMEGKDEFGYSWEDFKHFVLDEQLKEQGE